MKKLTCLLLVLMLLPVGFALADLEDWVLYRGDGFTIRYPDYMDVYGVPEEETGWNMDVLEDPSGRDDNGNGPIMLYVLLAGEEDWQVWQASGGFPDIYGEYIPMERLVVDEPPVLDEPPEVTMETVMDMSYALYRSTDGAWQLEAFIFDHPSEQDYVVLCRFPADDGGGYSDVLHWMIATMEFDGFAQSGETPGKSAALTEIPDFTGTLDVRPAGTEADAVAYAQEVWALDYLGMDFPVSYWQAVQMEDAWIVYAKDGPDDGDYCYGDVMFDFDGNVIMVENAASGVYEVMSEGGLYEQYESGALPIPDGPDEEAAAWRRELDRKVARPFFAAVCPEICAEYTSLYPAVPGTDAEFLTRYENTYIDSCNSANVFDLYYSGRYRDESFCIRIMVQTGPVLRIVDFDVYADAEEIGQG